MFSVFNDFPPSSSVHCVLKIFVFVVAALCRPTPAQGPVGTRVLQRSELRVPAAKGDPLTPGRRLLSSFQNLKATWLTSILRLWR